MRILSLRFHLFIFLLLFVISLGTIFGVSFEMRNRSLRELEEGFSVNLKLVVLLTQISEALQRIDSSAEEYLLTREPIFTTEFESASNTIKERLSSAAKLKADAQLAEIIHQSLQFLNRRAELIEMSRQNGLNPETIRGFILEESPKSQIFQKIHSLEESNLRDLEVRRLNADRATKLALLVKIIGGSIAAILLSVLLARYLIWPIARLERAANSWRLGDQWTVQSPVATKEFISLYSEMRAMTNRLNCHYFELLRSNKDLVEFASIASHDLRGPLSNIGGFVEILSEKLSSRVSDDEKKLLETIASNIHRMERLVQNLLAYARIGNSSLNTSTVPLNEIIEQVRDSLQPELERYSAVITYADLPTLELDRDQISQLFQNVFENSIKYRRSESLRIDVSAELQGNDWVVSVRDNGVGIPKHDLNRVFEIFHRSANVSGSKGVGLGLSITKRIVERHGGRIWLESELGKGSTVYFTLSKYRQIVDSRTILAQADLKNLDR